MPNIFISFRKVDNRWMRDRVYQALADAFGPEEIFKSGESIPAGGDFAAILRREAAECRVMLVSAPSVTLGAEESEENLGSFHIHRIALENSRNLRLISTERIKVA